MKKYPVFDVDKRNNLHTTVDPKIMVALVEVRARTGISQMQYVGQVLYDRLIEDGFLTESEFAQ